MKTSQSKQQLDKFRKQLEKIPTGIVCARCHKIVSVTLDKIIKPASGGLLSAWPYIKCECGHELLVGYPESAKKEILGEND